MIIGLKTTTEDDARSKELQLGLTDIPSFIKHLVIIEAYNHGDT